MTPPVVTAHLFEPLDRMLLELLGSLSPGEWEYQTIARLWKVRDVAAHLLDGNLRALSMQRDGYFGISPDDFSHAGIISWLNRTNAEWVKAAARLSPQVLIRLHEATGPETSRFFQSLQPFDKAVFDVTWAGEAGKWNWMHIAREYTEKWLHQQQIREAVGRQGIMTDYFYRPFLATLMYGLPRAYSATGAGTGSVVRISVPPFGSWHLIRTEKGWEPGGEGQDCSAIVEIGPGTAWKLFSKGIRPEEALADIQVSGREELVLPALNMVAVMA